MNPIILFLDLDDTLFQTQRKNPLGCIPATHNVSTISYMSQAQQHLWQLFQQHPESRIIPVTARDQRQYNNTFISQDPKVHTAVLYFSGLILQQGEIDQQWQARIQAAYQQLALPIKALHAQLQGCIPIEQQAYFKHYNVDGYYVTLKASQDCPLDLRDSVFHAVRTLLPPDYFIHENDRTVSLLPTFLDKRHAVAYLLERYQPALSIGAGDSLSDWGFMQLCDYRLIPAQTQLDSKITPSNAAG